jgi:formylmethanofuran dehydrogenase subunit E
MLVAYQTLPDDQLLIMQPVALTVSLEAIISQPGIRTHCEHCGEEIINEREVWVSGQCLCQACAGEAYYAVAVPEFVGQGRAIEHAGKFEERR